MAIPYQLQNRIKTKTSSSSSNSVISNSDALSILREKPFWLWKKKEHRALYLENGGLCCWNHIIGLPQKDEQDHPLYEQLLSDRLFSVNHDFGDKHLWNLKSTGLAVTEFLLRIIGWLCIKDGSFKGSQICIVTGLRQELTITKTI